MSDFTQSTAGPVYATFADPYCSTENTNDPSGNQLPIYAQWSANGACTYSLLAKAYKKETCQSVANVGSTGAFSNTWQSFSDPTCQTPLTTNGVNQGTGSEIDVREWSNDCPPSHFFFSVSLPYHDEKICSRSLIFSNFPSLFHAFIQKFGLTCRSHIFFSF